MEFGKRSDSIIVRLSYVYMTEAVKAYKMTLLVFHAYLLTPAHINTPLLEYTPILIRKTIRHDSTMLTGQDFHNVVLHLRMI